MGLLSKLGLQRFSRTQNKEIEELKEGSHEDHEFELSRFLRP